MFKWAWLRWRQSEGYFYCSNVITFTFLLLVLFSFVGCLQYLIRGRLTWKCSCNKIFRCKIAFEKQSRQQFNNILNCCLLKWCFSMIGPLIFLEGNYPEHADATKGQIWDQSTSGHIFVAQPRKVIKVFKKQKKSHTCFRWKYKSIYSCPLWCYFACFMQRKAINHILTWQKYWSWSLELEKEFRALEVLQIFCNILNRVQKFSCLV